MASVARCARMAFWLAAFLACLPCCGRRAKFTLEIVSESASPERITVVVHASEAGFWKKNLHADGAALDGELILRVCPAAPDGDQPGDSASSSNLASRKPALLPPLAGTFDVAGDSLRFTPAVALQPGKSYFACFSPGGWSGLDEHVTSAGRDATSVSGSSILVLRYSPPQQSQEAPRVLSIHPATPALPANALKFYIRFSQPMEQGVFLELLSLHDAATGREITGPFRETELWSPDGRRLTVWIHPGRQKSGVNLNEDEGPVLVESTSVSLRISGAWRATNGQSLGADVSRAWRVIAADHTQPEPRAWRFTPPAPGTRASFRVALDEPLDRALLESAIHLREPSGRAVEGTIDIPEGEREWVFAPKQDWTSDAWTLAIDPIIEDLAGNSPERLFETDATSKSEKRSEIILPVR